jgi:hypothetical protein
VAAIIPTANARGKPRESKLPAAKILDGPRRGIKNMKFFFMEKFVAPPSCLESASSFPLRWRSR